MDIRKPPGRCRSLSALLATVALLAAHGCGDPDSVGTRYPVSGTVTYNGKPLASGQINFLAADPKGRSAGGAIRDGAYSLTTQTPDDGALPGKYRVSVIAKDVDLSQIEAKSKKQGGTLPSKKDMSIAYKKAKKLIPSKYEFPDSSGLEAEVKEQSNTFDFKLTD